MRQCLVCDADISHKRKNAQYCTRTCKSSASGQRRKLDGRAVSRDRARYQREAPARREQARAAYWRDAEAKREYAIQWRKENPEARRIQNQSRRARLAGADVSHVSERDWKRLIVRAGGVCTYCPNRGPLVMDHVIPLARGGRHSIGNVTPACVPCNSSKSARLLADWRYRSRGR